MRRLVSFSIIAVLAGFVPSASAGSFGFRATPHPDAPAEMKQFQFLVGEWKAVLTALDAEGNRVEISGRWIGTYTLDGYAFQDDWYAPAVGYRGTTWRTWDPRGKRWVNRWLMANTDRPVGFTADAFYGNEVDGEIRLKATGTDARGPYVDRIVFTDIEADSFTWKQARSYDGGKTWIEDMAVTRAKRVR